MTNGWQLVSAHSHEEYRRLPVWCNQSYCLFIPAVGIS
jgi:hypothetical protein